MSLSQEKLLSRRNAYRARVECGMDVGDIVMTPCQLEAKVLSFAGDGRVNLRYLAGGKVSLKHTLLKYVRTLE